MTGGGGVDGRGGDREFGGYRLLEELGDALAPTEQNATLIAAVKAMAARRR